MLHQYIVGTDIARIGIWDRKWSGLSIREKSLFAFLKRLPADAHKKHLFFIETGSDGESGVHIYVDEDSKPNKNYRLISNDYSVEITSGKCVIDGLECYGKDYDGMNVFSIKNGTYNIEVFVLDDPESEESRYTQKGTSPKRHPIEKFAILGLASLITSIFLFLKRRYLVASSLFIVSLLYSYALKIVEKKRRSKNRNGVVVEVNVPYLIIFLKPAETNESIGGWISLHGSKA